MNSQLREILAALLAFDTTSRESNLGLIHWIRDYLAHRGISARLIHNASGSKANLYARLGPAGPGGIMLSGHTDVVPVAGQSWTVDPFVLTERDGRCYGRGSADMKGFIACVLASLDDFRLRPLHMPLHLAFSFDEEVGCLGVRSLVDMLEQATDKPAMCIVGEPTEMRPVFGHKGKLAVRCQVSGHACHSAYAPQGVNAIHYAARLINRLTDTGDALKSHQDLRFSPPFSTLQVGTIRGGNALNIVPQSCDFDFEIRYLPGSNAQDVVADLRHYSREILLPQMHEVAPSGAIEFTELSAYPGLLTDTASPFARWLASWLGDDGYTTVPYGTEGGLFDAAGIGTLVCGPGSMDQGHKADEYVTVEQLMRCRALLKTLSGWMQQPAQGNEAG